MSASGCHSAAQAADHFWPKVPIRAQDANSSNCSRVFAPIELCVSDTIASPQTLLRGLRLYCP
jgi:hypothetical protein